MNPNQRRSRSTRSSTPEVGEIGNFPQAEPSDRENEEDRPLTPFPVPEHVNIDVEPTADYSINMDPPAVELPELPHAMPVPSTSSSAHRTRREPEHEAPPVVFQPGMPSTSASAKLPTIDSESVGSGSSSDDFIPPTPLSPKVHVLHAFDRSTRSSSVFSIESIGSRHLIRKLREIRRLFNMTNTQSVSSGLYMTASFMIPQLPELEEPYELFIFEDEEEILTRSERRQAHEDRRAKEQQCRDYKKLGKGLLITLPSVCLIFFGAAMIDTYLVKVPTDFSSFTASSEP